MKERRGTCTQCGKPGAVTARGVMRWHLDRRSNERFRPQCEGVGQPPALEAEPGRKVANGLFGPGIFGSGIDVTQLDDDTAMRLGGFLAEQIEAAEWRGFARAFDALADGPNDDIVQALQDVSYLGKSVTRAHARYLATAAMRAAMERLDKVGR